MLVQLLAKQHAQHSGKQPQPSTSLALGVVLKILKAARQLAAADSAQPDMLGGAGSSILAVVIYESPTATTAGASGSAPATGNYAAGQAREAMTAQSPAEDQSLMQLANRDGSDAVAEDETGSQGASGNAVTLLQLQVLTELVSFPAEQHVLSQQVGLLRQCLQTADGIMLSCEPVQPLIFSNSLPQLMSS